MGQYDCFLYPDALALNEARLEHLASLNLPIDNRRVLEVGAGIGLHSQFFLDRGCEVMITDGAPANMPEIRKRHPRSANRLLDLELVKSVKDLGDFDVVYCYGLLYHMSDPESVLQKLSEVCKEILLLELICDPSPQTVVNYVRDPGGLNQSTIGRGCRPSRSWILQTLRACFEHAYISKTQPDHQEFPSSWTQPSHGNTRAIFVASRQAIENDLLLTEPLQQQEKYQKGR